MHLPVHMDVMLRWKAYIMNAVNTTDSTANDNQSGRIGSCQSHKMLAITDLLKAFALNWSFCNFSESGKISRFCLKIGRAAKSDSSLEAWTGRTVQKKRVKYDITAKTPYHINGIKKSGK